ncbi:hypothetical protein FIBSPDRAFT_890801 [Athelia psychrophila]|uniref:Uncharacterized protein n=1 Tax=Athelia psychrophila TaxID=1759441 RepID=A0A166KKS0_9AGAM|nr:hypothetical protein FIBSPDRAFT_890801 [Fibularhizoctonia sp. CBS 109695]
MAADGARTQGITIAAVPCANTDVIGMGGQSKQLSATDVCSEGGAKTQGEQATRLTSLGDTAGFGNGIGLLLARNDFPNWAGGTKAVPLFCWASLGSGVASKSK